MSKEQQILASMYDVQEDLEAKKTPSNVVNALVKQLEEYIKREQLIPLV